MAAPFHQIGNLTAIVDRNRIQNDRFTSEVMGLEPLGDRWQAFGWETIEIDGHDYSQILPALEKAQISSEKPTVIIANTVKGKGISFMENNPEFHGKPPNPEQLALALQELQDGS